MINRDIKMVVLIGAVITIALSIVCLFIEPWCALICMVLGAAIVAVFAYYTKKRYDSLKELNNYLSLVCAGNYDLDINDNEEGELSILKNNLYKVITILRTQNDMLKKDKLYLADSLADISHQLKTPLTSMMVMTDLLKTEQKEEKKQEFIAVIENQLDKMRWLIQNLLKLSKLDAGTVEFKKEQVSAREIVDESIKPFLVTLDLKQISYVNHVEDFIINGDKNWNIEALENIIKNCIEHTDKNGELVISSISTNIYDEILIADNGSGISKADLPHIFERFYRGTNSSGDSVGIGLALAKTIIERERGSLEVTSTEGEGTQFAIRFYKSIV
ncbi:MAG: HAMP domain-containing histidine kinase [Clostridium sp.]|nr:HAMP domain-containing histidine kinase [Clostridium sp.]